MYRQYKTTSTAYWNYRDTDKEGLTIKKPVAVELIKKIVPNVKAFAFEFHRTAFKQRGIDHNQYLEEILTAFPVEYVEISGSKYLDSLPECLQNQRLQTFKLNNCPNVQDFSILGQLKTLLKVEISGDTYQLGTDFYQLPRLMDLALSANEIKDVDKLPQLNKLRHLKLSTLNNELLPDGLEKLTLLKTLELNDLKMLTQLPSFKLFSALQELKCYRLPKVTTLPDDFEHLEKLNTVALINLGEKQQQFTLPPTLVNHNFLEILTIVHCPVKYIPNIFPKGSALKKMYLGNLSIETLPTTFSNLSQLTELQLRACKNFKSFNGTINQFKALKVLFIEALPELLTLDFAFYELTALETLQLINLPRINQLPHFGHENSLLKEVTIKGLMQLKTLPETLSHCELLRKLSLTSIGVATIPVAYRKLIILNHFSLYDAPNLKYIPSDLIDIGRGYFAISNTPAFRSEQLPLTKIVEYTRKMLPPHLRPIVAYWLFENYGKEPLTEAIKKATISILSIAHSDVQQLIQQNLQYLNTGELKLGDAPIPPNEPVTIIGMTQNSRSFLRKELKALGFKYKLKLSPTVKYVLVGKKPPIAADFWKTPRLLFSEQAFTAYQKIHNPGLLQKADTPKAYIDNLRQLIWSTDPTNELIALELVKNNGLPAGLDMDFIVATKTGKDKNVRNKMRRFLKGCLKNGALQVLNDRTVMTRSYEPFYKYKGMVSNPELAQLVVAFYKRFGTYSQVFFRYDDGTSPYRQEMLAAYLPSLLEKPKYLKIYADLTEAEINEILANPIFDGKLERLLIDSDFMEKIPSGIFKHLSIKKLELKGKFLTNELPTALFDMYKLTELKLHWENLTHLSTDIHQLKRLKELFIYSKHSITLPENFNQLAKLKRGHFSKGIEEYVNWAEAMPAVVFR